MSHSIIASNIPLSTKDTKVHQFFSLCGEILAIEPFPTLMKHINETNQTKTVRVVFEKTTAVDTALLLNGVELEGKVVHVVNADHPAEVDDVYNIDSMANSVGDIRQELKPKSAVAAEYLSHGYVLSDNILNRAVQFDKEHGYTTSFKTFLHNLDNDYHLDAKKNKLTEEVVHLDNEYHVSESLGKYYSAAVNTTAGTKLHSFYTHAVDSASAIHEEAKRLANLKEAGTA